MSCFVLFIHTIPQQVTGFDGEKSLAARCFGDTDTTFRIIMAQLMPEAELKVWEQGRPARMRAYDKQRKA